MDEGVPVHVCFVHGGVWQYPGGNYNTRNQDVLHHDTD